MANNESEVIRESLSVGESVAHILASAFPRLSRDDLHDAVTDAVIEWHSVSPERPPVSFSSLYRAAWRNAANRASSERARKQREASWQSLQASERARFDPLATESEGSFTVELIVELLPDRAMRLVFRLWIKGERPAQSYARALGLSKLPIDVQRKRVNREKDRLVKYLNRNPVIRAAAARLQQDSKPPIEAP
jgi:hypothetical protein